MKSINELLSKLNKVREVKPRQYIAICPGHHDTRPSLSIKQADDKIVLKCFAGCTTEAIVQAMGLTLDDLFLNDRKPQWKSKEIVSVYPYHNADGQLLYEVVRFKPKSFAQRRPDGKGGYIWNLDGITPVLYRLPDIRKAVLYGDTIYLVEGEDDANGLWEIGLVATTNPMGAGKWQDWYSDTLIGGNIVIIADKDTAGRSHADYAAKSLYSKAALIKVLQLPGDKIKDTRDWLAAGGTRGELEQLVSQASLYAPPRESKEAAMLTLAAWRQKVIADPPTEDLIKDILPNACTEYMLVCGRAGIGKTNLVLYLAFCLATGTPFLSHKTKQCRTGYLGFEGTPRKLLARFDKLQDSFHDPGDFLLVERSLPFKLSRTDTDKFTRKIEGLEIIIIDPLRYIVCDDYTKPEAASTFISTLRECCAKTGTIPILVHHVRKPDRRLTVRPEDLAFEVKGATDYVDAAATVLLMERAQQPRNKDGRFGSNPDDRILHFCKVKDAPAELLPLRLQFNRETLIYEPTLDFEAQDDEYPNRIMENGVK